MAHSFKTATRMLGASGCRGAGLNRARFGAADLVDLRSEIRVGDRSARRPARSKHFGFKVLQRDRFKCVLCGDHRGRNQECVLNVDHQIPWSKGGKTREDNLRTLCATCNVGRGDRFTD